MYVLANIPLLTHADLRYRPCPDVEDPRSRRAHTNPLLPSPNWAPHNPVRRTCANGSSLRLEVARTSVWAAGGTVPTTPCTSGDGASRSLSTRLCRVITSICTGTSPPPVYARSVGLPLPASACPYWDRGVAHHMIWAALLARARVSVRYAVDASRD
ncbi:uncharacterized protein C8Q71DRAFT_741676 [Rhodofomes roseus]|uniref:Uncharacterized protein n=1 Tax=Rhodofomes roseus TaxID=34475 RepID=A0ABQ8KQD9_9APHY|nr:uncharacterized protein C8Q71DRAFT_741676 [Rhodofomes roseus]KAH9840848.1 hypothetical protein C8Q71DRAFT_741676 [Rhodofomes roseus]